MDITQQGILQLLKSAITEEPQVLPEEFDIEAAYPLIRKHHMVTLCYDGAVRCGVDRKHPVMQQMFGAYCKAMMISEGQMRQLKILFGEFDKNGIDYLPLKGCNMKALYPKPELRTMGDADVLIRVDQYEKIIPIMEALGFQPVLESDHELTWRSPSLYLELHKCVIPTYNKDYYAYFGNGWDRAKREEGSRYGMTREDTWIYLFSHFAKHYRDGGIGCRHVVDLWVYRRENSGMDEAYIGAELEKLQLREFHGYICQLMNVWFEGAQMDERTEVLTTCIFASGSWGSKEDSVLSQAIKDCKHAPLGFSGRLVYLRKLLFPGIETMRRMYPVLEKAPWLLPVMWLVRPFYKALFHKSKFKQHRENLNLLSRKKLEGRQKMLHYVGLDYNF